MIHESSYIVSIKQYAGKYLSVSQYCSFSVRDFLGKVCKYPHLSEAITPHLNTISVFLEANPNYGGIEEIEVDYNLVEVSNVSSNIVVSFCHF